MALLMWVTVLRALVDVAVSVALPPSLSLSVCVSLETIF